ncbi:MAG: LPS export ABC transporter permease LptF [Candidatus Endonucleobacter sp. (ex Gigantidas childressi)]|nr:LPS export ABC transporter permease LptF [Candidatus Endonucleobacter sp. (ex Gigantidas childressi)]
MPFIIFRYLTLQMLKVLFAVSLIVLLILMSGRFISYLSLAASGLFNIDFLVQVVAYRIPEFLMMIIPLGLFLGIIISYSRLYIDNEMTVLSACGVSPTQLLGMTMIPAIGVMIIVAYLSLYLAPASTRNVELILSNQDNMTEFEAMVPGRFKVVANGSRATYSESMSNDKRIMRNIFIANRDQDSKDVNSVTIILAGYAKMEKRGTGIRYLLLNDGYRHDLTPGQPGVRSTKYKTYGFELPSYKAMEEVNKEQALSTEELLESDLASHIGELQWRLSLPLSIPILVLLAIPLARVNPRHGRYVKLLPALLLYMLYIMLLISAREAVIDDRLSSALGVWWVHICYLLLAVVFYCYEPVKMIWARRRVASG